MLELRIADWLQALPGNRVLEADRKETAHHLFLDFLGETRPHDVGGHLSLAEARQICLTAELGRDAAGFVRDPVGGNLDLDGFADWGKIFKVH